MDRALSFGIQPTNQPGEQFPTGMTSENRVGRPDEDEQDELEQLDMLLKKHSSLLRNPFAKLKLEEALANRCLEASGQTSRKLETKKHAPPAPTSKHSNGSARTERSKSRRNSARVPKQEFGRLNAGMRKDGKPRRKYKFRNTAGGYVHAEALFPSALPPVPERIVLGTHPVRHRTVVGHLFHGDKMSEEDLEAVANKGWMSARKIQLEPLTVREWMQLAKARCDTDEIVSLADPRTHDLQSEALRTYVVHHLRGNLEPSPEKGDDCKGSPKLTAEQCQQLFNALIWNKSTEEAELVAHTQEILDYYYWGGWRVKIGPLVVRPLDSLETPGENEREE
jgi:hypothetical protein